ncbi:MAG TPA: integrin alpha [Phycisphaerae bacterium]|nr:integrin alpha [Phycisphaerae bacterium]
MPHQTKRFQLKRLQTARFSKTAIYALIGVTVFFGCIGDLPRLVLGPGVIGNVPPSLQILAPVANINRNQGEPFEIQWTDDDRDSPALISFSLVNVVTGTEIVLVSNIQENDNAGPDQFSASTGLIPLGTYNLLGRISDGLNEVVSVYALVTGSSSQRVQITIGEPGTNPLNVPPQVAVIQPAFNQGVAQDDTLVVTVRPTSAPVNENLPYDADSESELFIVLDLNDISTDDDPRLPDPDEIIVLRQQDIPMGSTEELTFNIAVDLGVIPPRPNGEPYRVRATIIDAGNQRVHAYAQGSINILRSATGTVDLLDVGTILSGAVFQGFNPGSRLGSNMVGVGDFDADGVDDFVLVAQFGNPRNFGNIGEAYVIYGLNQGRFGGVNNVNSVSRGISGTILEAPPNRLQSLHDDPLAVPRGITSVAPISDVSGDGRPEILIGMGMVDGLYQGRDDDPGDGVEAVDVQFSARFGLQTLTNNGTAVSDFDDAYEGVIDTYIDRNDPNGGAGGEQLLLYGATSDQEADRNQFPIIGFDLPDELFIPDPDNIAEISATIVLTFQGTPAISTETFAVHRLNLGVNDNTDFNDFNGSDGTPGPTEGTDYDDEEIDYSVSFGVNGQLITTTMLIDVTDVVQQVVDGEIGTRNPQFIILPILPVNGAIFSSEAVSEANRPLLRLSFDEDRASIEATFNCYPDPYVNNLSTGTPIDDPGRIKADSTLEACGVAVMVTSENRDTAGPVSATRLDSTVFSLELAGQEEVVSLSPTEIIGNVNGNPADGPISHTAGDPGTGGRGRGCRFQAGFWDFINDGALGEANPRTDFFGEHVASVADITLNGTPEFIMSAPRNELYTSTILQSPAGSADAKIFASRRFTGSIVVLDGNDYSTNPLFSDTDGTNQNIPNWGSPSAGTCTSPRTARSGTAEPVNVFEVYAEDMTDYLGGAEAAGDMNRDGVPDIICGAPLNDSSANGRIDTGAVYILQGRSPFGDISLSHLDDPAFPRPTVLRIRGEKTGDKIGHRQTGGRDVNGDGIGDVFISSPNVDFLSTSATHCADANLSTSTFTACRNNFGNEVFIGDTCKQYDFDNDRDIDEDDQIAFDNLVAGFAGACPIDNGYAAVIFGNVTLDGDRTISQVGTSSLPGVIFFGANPGDRAGEDIVSAGDFNRDGFGDLLIAAPGVRFTDNNNRERMGVAYLIFGGTHLNNAPEGGFSLDQVGTPQLPGLVFWSPYETGRPNEAPIDNVGLLGDINNDGFDDIGLGLTRSDFVDENLPQTPGDVGTDPNIGRRPDDGRVYIIYGNNTVAN